MSLSGVLTLFVLSSDSHPVSVFSLRAGDDAITRTSQLNVGTAADLSLKIAETDLSVLSASIRAPSGNEEPCLLKRLPNRHIGERGTRRGRVDPPGSAQPSLKSGVKTLQSLA